MEDNYLDKGLLALAIAGEKSVFSGHYGAAFLAAYFMDEENDLPEHVKESLTRNCTSIEKEHQEFFDYNQLPEKNQQANLDPLVQSIRQNLKVLRSSGHGVILGVLALKALKKRPELCTEFIVNGISRLVLNALNDRQNRYYHYDNYFLVTEDDVFGIPTYHSTEDLIEVAFAECRWAAPDQSINGNYYFFSGELEHGVTLAHALVELEQMGYEELARTGYHIHRLQMFLNRQRPEEIIQQTIVAPGLSSVLDKKYWAQTFKDPHSIKVPYATLSLLKKLSPSKRDTAEYYVCKLLSEIN